MSKKIQIAMLIDDEEIDIRQYKRILDRSGLIETVMTFTYADDALAFLAQGDRPNVDVIFLDINMPRKNGFEFLAEATDNLGNNFAKIVVAMLTTSLNPDDRNRAAEFQVVREFINKPLTTQHVERVAKLLE